MLTCPECSTTGSDIMGIEEPGVYDGILYWDCMRCGHLWHSWPAENHRGLIAASFIRRRLLLRPSQEQPARDPM